MPSYRYSLVRGRLPLMRGRNWPFGSATPGDSVTSGMKLRPSSGSVEIFLSSMFMLTSPLAVCSSGAAAMTSIDCEGWPTCKLHVELRALAKPENDSRLPVAAESGLFDEEHVPAGGQAEDMVFTPLAGNGGISNHGRLVLGFHLRFGDRQSGRIPDGAIQFRPAALCVAQDRSEHQSHPPWNQSKVTCKHDDVMSA